MIRTVLPLSADDRQMLEKWLRSQTAPASLVRRARLILMLADGIPQRETIETLGCDFGFIQRWKHSFTERGTAGLGNQPRGRRPDALTPKDEARILAATRKPPTDGSTHWSTRRLGRVLGYSHVVIANVWKRAGLKPHRLERYMASNDPDFERKAADVIGLYLNPPANAAVFCVDEKSHIQALDRRDRILPFSPGRAERHGFEYVRHGTLSLLAAMETRTGEVIGQTVARHTSAEFVAFLTALVEAQPAEREIHIIADNLATHKTKRVAQFLEAHQNVKMHYTPTYSSWLNQVEMWFSKIERQMLRRGVFTSVGDLSRKIKRYIKLYNQTATPIRWSYSNPKHRIKPAIGSGNTLH